MSLDTDSGCRHRERVIEEGGNERGAGNAKSQWIDFPRAGLKQRRMSEDRLETHTFETLVPLDTLPSVGYFCNIAMDRNPARIVYRAIFGQ